MDTTKTSELFNFLHGTENSGESTYDIWKAIYNNGEGTPEQFLDFIRNKNFEGATLAGLTMIDTNGILGEANAEVNAQSLIDAIAQKVNGDINEINEIIDTI